MEIRCDADTATEREIADELASQLETFDLSPWQWTDSVVIREDAIPHSHPVLTLGTFNRGPFLLSSYVHEQLHWYALERMKLLETIFETDLLTMFPDVPVDLPDGGASADSTYLHLFVCWWEVDALRQLLGEERAGKVLEVMIENGGAYRWVYRTIRDRYGELGRLFERHGLASPGRT